MKDNNYENLTRDIAKYKKQLMRKEPYENFGDKEIRALKDKYFRFLTGNYNDVHQNVNALREFEDWCCIYDYRMYKEYTR